MRIIARGTLRKFWKVHPDCEQALKAWFKFVSDADWQSPKDIKRDYVSASFLKNERVCFNICGNKYRLVTRINYPFRVVYIRFIGTHKLYERIDVNEV